MILQPFPESKIISSTWKSDHGSGYHAEIQRVVDTVVLYHLMSLAANEDAANQVRAIASHKIAGLKTWLATQKSKDESQRAHVDFALAQIERFQRNPKNMNLSKPVDPPAGSPIGVAQDLGSMGFGYGWK